MTLIDQIRHALVTLQAEEAESLVREAIDKRLDPAEVLNKGILTALGDVGKKFQAKEYFLSELLQSSGIAKKCIALITPHLPKRRKKTAGTIVIGTIEGDMHEIGKNLVAFQLRIHGFEVYDLGINVPALSLVQKAQEVGADIIGISAMLTGTLQNATDVIGYLKDMGLRDTYKVIVGGAATNQENAQSYGVDAWAADAVEAASVCKGLLK